MPRCARAARRSRTRFGPEARHQAGEQAFMANVIGSLRLIATFDWSEFFESVSLVEQVLQRDPAAVYARMDFASRDRYRHAVEEIAEPTGEAQVRVALKCVERGRQVAERHRRRARTSATTWWAPGGAVRAWHRMAAGTAGQLQASLFRHATLGYLGTIAVGTSALVAAAVTYAQAQGWQWPMLTIVAVLTIVPASELTIHLLQRLIAWLIAPRRLPRLDLAQIPDSARTMVIIPTILDSAAWARISPTTSRCRRSATSIRTSTLRSSVISRTPRPKRCRTTTRFLPPPPTRSARSTRYADGGPDRFFLFHRSRQWNAQEGSGWGGSASGARSKSSTACSVAAPIQVSS